MLKKTIALTTTAVLLGVTTVGTMIGNYFVNYGLVRTETPDEDDPLSPTYEKSEHEKSVIAYYDEKVAEWQEENTPKDVYLTSHDGLNLWANEYNNQDDEYWLVAVHGYQSDHKAMEDICYEYFTKGYNIILPDLRAHGNSEGEYIGMGLYDSMDILLWVDYIIEQNPNAKIVLHGHSMGGATVMMTAGHEDLPENVFAVVEDCGYTNAYQMMTEQLKYRFNMPGFPIMNFANMVANVRADYNMKDANPIKSLESSTVPILFIHGDADIFVLPYMHTELYESYDGPKDSLLVAGAGHVASRNIEPENYYNKVFDFISKYDVD